MSRTVPIRAETSDWVRQGVVVLAAVAQIVSSSFFGRSVGGVAREDTTSILPAGYAFAIWGLIFAVSLAAAVTGVAPSVAARPALRASGWFIAVAYTANAVWVLVFPQRLFLLSQVVIVIGAVAAILATVRLQRNAGPRDRLVGVLVGGSYGLLAGWLTAAAFVGLANTLVNVGLSGGGADNAVQGIVLLLLATGVAVAVLRACADGPIAGTVAYAGAVAWGLVAISVEQWGSVTSTALTALVLALILLGYLAVSVTRRLRTGATRPPARKRTQRPDHVQ
ncbi:hypothetical protein [Allokutzneria sp. NRRL B-24872]|uniref:hypothetical protein n=1 Tax=Allokutzneria sp. NRRL B-24872 TaxID=1137961 RepID=UPI0011773A9D|nr:hypothetical protein [Allokutzneria sp. NRRL B-24872]